ncbi:DUF1561 family protein [Bartonella ancashensis]|uniref:Ricin B lectin domain-containing protein n=1 Tax=Bartonella ancashensis TaxID=1318743 RepID=A0A0M4L746_9HYPH|nr:DUF1561 family protein [Bartonella ancashensis]ALE03658.1 hypothetical protein PU02_0844 [Bartonella ancashensis]
MKLKVSLLFPVLLLSIDTSYAAPIPQKLPDTPHDKAIRIKVHTGSEYCYAPVFTKGEGYVYIDACSSPNAIPGRYDLFQRVSWKIKDTWLCMTAPNSVTGIDGKSTTSWDYLLLRPCVINDANQRWIIKDNSFYTADKRFRVKDIKWYAYISKDKDNYYNHTLASQMQSWTTRVAPPGNISSKTFMGWPFVNISPPSFQFYYIQNNSSSLSEVPLPLYYNPENGHIAQYDPVYGTFSCIRSKQSSSDNWNWVEWKYCTDQISSKKDSFYWDLSLLDNSEGFVLDYQGNPLRVTQFGANWGVPYTVKSSYIEQDTQNSPKSSFTFSPDIDRWNRYVNGNLGDTLSYCPAPGKKANVSYNSTNHVRVNRSLPPEFNLTDDWITRLWQIATTSLPEKVTTIAYCGPCILHTIQMLAELQGYYQSGPLQRGGYFFDTNQGTDPFVSLRQRFPEIATRLQATEVYNTMPARPGEDLSVRTSRVSRVIASMLLPQYLWLPSNVARTEHEMRLVFQDFFNAPVGTIGFFTIIYKTSRSSIGYVAHVQPIIRTNQGVVSVPTNAANLTREEFIQHLTPTTTPDIFFRLLSRREDYTLYSFSTFQMRQLNIPPLNLFVSQNNCTGEGEDRRGSGRLPAAAFINQCSSGRCFSQ